MKKLILMLLLLCTSFAVCQTKVDINTDTKNSLPANRIGSAPYTNLTSTCTGAQGWNLNSQLIFNAKITTTGACTLNLTNPVAGGNYILVIIHGSGGSITLGTGCNWAVANSGAGAITESSGIGAVDVLAFSYDGVNCYAIFNTSFN